MGIISYYYSFSMIHYYDLKSTHTRLLVSLLGGYDNWKVRGSNQNLYDWHFLLVLSKVYDKFKLMRRTYR